MGKNPGDIAGEIDHLRSESDLLLDELLRRTTPSHMAKGITSGLSERAESLARRGTSGMTTVANRADYLVHEANKRMPEPLQRYPYAVPIAVFSLATAIGAFVASRLLRPRPRTLQERAAETLKESRQRAAEGVSYSRDQAEDLLQEAMERLRREMEQRGIVVERRREPSPVKRVAWSGTTSAMGALGSMLFAKAAERAWKSAMHEAPPKK